MNKSIQVIAQEIDRLLNNIEKAVIFSHTNPDGDAVGSSLGLYHYLKTRVRETNVIMPNKYPDFLGFLPGAENILFFDTDTVKSTEAINKAEIIFYLDFNDPARINKMGEIASSNKGIKVLLDHHPQPVEFANFTISEIEVSSTAELVYEFILLLAKSKNFQKEMADCLLTGIITDTGLFSHNSERGRTFEIVAALLEIGADKSKIIQKVYNEYTYNRFQLLGNALYKRLKYFPEYNAAFIYLPKTDLAIYHHQVGDTEGFVNLPLSIAGVKFSGIFLEKEDHVKCSFRSAGDFDVNLFARKHFNGGGHKNASGGKSFETLNNTIENFVNLLEKYKDDLTR